MADEISYNIYNKEEIYTDCTVQVWSNTITGDGSVGWWENRWIPVQKARPPTYTDLLTWDGHNILIDYFDGYGFGLANEVTHWRLLPQPPRGNE